MKKLLLLLIVCTLFGCKNGIKEEINSEGDTCFINYKWGNKEGNSNCFYFNGVKKSESWYEDGKLNSIRNYDNEGLMTSYAKYKNEKIILYETYHNGDNLNINQKSVWDYENNTINQTGYYPTFRLEHVGTWGIDPYEPIGIWNYYWKSGLKRMEVLHEPRNSAGIKKEIYRCWTSQGQEIPNCTFLDSRLK